MTRNRPHATLPCAYCGRVTGRNQSEHVVPRCLYTNHIPSTQKRLTVPACRDCNHGFSVSEAHFRNIVAASGLNPSPERQELLDSVYRSLYKPKSGRRDVERLWHQMRDTTVLKADGTPYKRVIPHEDEEVRFIARKVVRGLANSLDGHTVVPDDRVIVREFMELPDEVAIMLERGFSLPGHFSSYYVLIDSRFPETVQQEMHSFWQITFFELTLSCLVIRQQLPEQSSDT